MNSKKIENKQKLIKIENILVRAIGLFIACLGIFMFVSFLTANIMLDPVDGGKQCMTGLGGFWLAYVGIYTFGKTAVLILAIMVISWGINITKNAEFLTTWAQVLGGILITIGVDLGYSAVVDRYNVETGGLFIMYIAPATLLYLGRTGIVIISMGISFLGILMAFGEMAVEVIRWIIFSLRNSWYGIIEIAHNVSTLIKMLFAPKMATVGNDNITQDINFANALKSSQAAIKEKKKEYKIFDKVWKPKEKFVSSYENNNVEKPIATEVLDIDIDCSQVEEEKLEDKIFAVDNNIGDKTESSINDYKEDDSECEVIENIVEEKVEESIKENAIEEPVEVKESIIKKILKDKIFKQENKNYNISIKVDKSVDNKNSTIEEEGDEELAKYKLPELELLDPVKPPVVENREYLEKRAKILEETLAEFKIDGKVVHIESGPRVTLYEISLAPGIRLNKVTSLADNIAMKLSAQSVRIIAPIPGKDTIGIEVPNKHKELVNLKEIVEFVARNNRKQAIPVCLGKDVAGAPLIADLTKMPHLLIAGATGSGKSVCINSIILSVMMCCKPEETQMIMIDPKVVELSRFKDIPHLMSPVITDMKRAVSVLDWICQKMDERYEQMSLMSVNNISKFNALGEDEIIKRLEKMGNKEETIIFPKSLPYMVVIIDELADLMMVAGKEVEQHITRLAAKSRAVGIHLILATQRPSVDVITGLIKANMPCRIAFQVSSRVDSRTILDQNGAETLLGQGDMLYLPPGVGKLTRAQGVFVSDDELFKVVDYVKDQAQPQYHSDLLGPVIGGSNTNVDISSFDELFIDSAREIIESGRGSVSLLQRKFGIGYGRAARIIDQLASVGVLGTFREGKAREILMDMDEFSDKFMPGKKSNNAWDEELNNSMAGLREDEKERYQEDWDTQEEN